MEAKDGHGEFRTLTWEITVYVYTYTVAEIYPTEFDAADFYGAM